MKIVNRPTFLTLPAGTLYQKFIPCVTDEQLAIKAANCGDDDWFMMEISGTMIREENGFPSFQEMEDAGTSSPAQFICGRDGCFDKDQFFLVWERTDVEALVKILDSALKGTFAADQGFPS
jgi:hypothetical protein